MFNKETGISAAELETRISVTRTGNWKTCSSKNSNFCLSHFFSLCSKKKAKERAPLNYLFALISAFLKLGICGIISFLEDFFFLETGFLL